MPKKTFIDAGPLVAFLDGDEQNHAWAANQFEHFPRFVTCEAVLAEACARLAYAGLDQWRVLELVNDGALVVEFSLAAHAGRVQSLMEKFADQPMDFADACLVAMTEEVKDCAVVTLDRTDFAVYRRNGRDLIPLVTPDKS